MNDSTKNLIKRLCPKIIVPATKFIYEAETLLNVRLLCTLRTVKEQDDLYEQGRTKPGQVVTNARGLTSYHNYGLALDVVFNGSTPWGSQHNWKALGALGKKYGFEWGGDWTSLRDLPHFQMTFGYSVQDLAKMYNKNSQSSLNDLWRQL